MSLVELSSLFWLALTFQWEFKFSGSFKITGVGENWILCMPLCAELDAMVRKLISLVCFDIFQSKWYQSALIGVPKIVFAIKAFRCHFDWKMSKQIKNISFDIFQSKWYRNALIGVPKVVFAVKAPTRANCHKPTLRWAILRNATLFVCTLYHSTLPWAISSKLDRLVWALCYSTLR